MLGLCLGSPALVKQIECSRFVLTFLNCRTRSQKVEFDLRIRFLKRGKGGRWGGLRRKTHFNFICDGIHAVVGHTMCPQAGWGGVFAEPQSAREQA